MFKRDRALFTAVLWLTACGSEDSDASQEESASISDAGPDASLDAAAPSTSADASRADASRVDASRADAATVDAATVDAAIADAAIADASLLDAATKDAAIQDAATQDAAAKDAAVQDAAVKDSATPPQDSGGPATPVDAGASVKYANVSPIFSRYCVSCHKAGGQGPFPLNNYTDASANAADAYMMASTGMMPPVGTGPTNAELATLLAWVQAGTPQ